MEKVSNNPPMVPAKGIKTLYEWLEEIVIALTLVILVFTFLFRVVTVTGESMLPNFVEGQKLIVTNLAIRSSRGRSWSSRTS